MSLELLFSLAAVVFSLLKLGWIYWGSMKAVRATIDPVPFALWTVLGLATLAPQIAEMGWEWAMLLGVINVIINLGVLWIARKHDWQGLSRGDWLMVGVAITGLLLWAWQREGSYGLFFCLIADAVGVARIWHKAWNDPERELIGTWMMGTLAAVSAYASALYAPNGMAGWYPLYVIFNASGSVLIIIGRRKYLSRRRRLAATAQPAVEVA